MSPNSRPLDFRITGAAYCRVMDSEYWPRGWALSLLPEHRAQTPAEADIERAEIWYRLTELEKVEPPPELRPLHEVALRSLRAWLDGSDESFSEMYAAELEPWDTMGLYDLLGTYYGVCAWPECRRGWADDLRAAYAVWVKSSIIPISRQLPAFCP